MRSIKNYISCLFKFRQFLSNLKYFTNIKKELIKKELTLIVDVTSNLIFNANIKKIRLLIEQ